MMRRRSARAPQGALTASGPLEDRGPRTSTAACVAAGTGYEPDGERRRARRTSSARPPQTAPQIVIIVAIASPLMCALLPR
ncbi:MAG: hypothetical protein DWQ36_00200 [Acidobacteria bacterium]|nr:MAG: hypothetical protein DWQ30_18350 [Acidobacteriota bacterium]REK12125.1 MAG: hypothetical protein DWQ36_00200 [Acidobacteriota bacterium]